MDAVQGRFLERDLLGRVDGDENLYRLVANNPTNTTDPSGLKDEKCPAAKNGAKKEDPCEVLKGVISTLVTLDKSEDAINNIGNVSGVASFGLGKVVTEALKKGGKEAAKKAVIKAIVSIVKERVIDALKGKGQEIVLDQAKKFLLKEDLEHAFYAYAECMVKVHGVKSGQYGIGNISGRYTHWVTWDVDKNWLEYNKYGLRHVPGQVWGFIKGLF